MLNFQFSNGSHEETEIKNKNEVICDLLETARQDEIPDGKIRDKRPLQPLYVDQGTEGERRSSPVTVAIKDQGTILRKSLHGGVSQTVVRLFFSTF